MHFPEDLKYTPGDMWVRVEGVEAVVGVTAFAQAAMGSIAVVQVPQVGQQFHQGDFLGTLESHQAASEVPSPISGVVAAVNTDLVSAPDTVNNDPYGAGWIVRLSPSNLSELNGLLSATDYRSTVEARS